jgi:hypothetical protein
VPDDPIPAPLDADGFLPSDAPPPWGSEVRDARLTRLLKKARALPEVPGVYLMKDHAGVVLYVGKASRLPDRVASYFIPSADLGYKKHPMLDLVHDFEVLPCEGEWEALLAENRLIKDIQPRFNARLTDDKTFPYLIITQREDFPRVFITRNPGGIEDDGSVAPEMKGARIYGPFTNVGALREAIQILQRVFKFRTCKLDIIDGDEKNRYFRPCLLYAINQCTAPCAAKISKDGYRIDVDHFVRFIGSKRSVMLREMRQEMEKESAALNFERAAVLRDQIRAIEKLDERAERGEGWQPETELERLDPRKALASLQKTLGLDEPIRCIEGIDIAHLQGERPSAPRSASSMASRSRASTAASASSPSPTTTTPPSARSSAAGIARPARAGALPRSHPHRRRPGPAPRRHVRLRAARRQAADGHLPRQKRKSSSTSRPAPSPSASGATTSGSASASRSAMKPTASPSITTTSSAARRHSTRTDPGTSPLPSPENRKDP